MPQPKIVAPNGLRFTARELIEALFKGGNLDSPIMIHVDVNDDVVIGGRLHEITYDKFKERWDFSGPKPERGE